MTEAKVTKAVIAAAGFGTRFLPQTKAMPKEMLPVVDKPVIQYLVEDLVEAGIKDIIIVGSSSKRSIEDHFDVPNEDLLANLRAGGAKKQHYIDELYRLSNLANFIYIRQKGPYGNATPLANAAHEAMKATFSTWVWPMGCIEDALNIEEKGEAAIIAQEDSIRNWQPELIDQEFPVFRSTLDWMRAI